jgi:tRNA (mo5U34)-methyltransferase
MKMPGPSDVAALRRRIDEHRWYHEIDLGNGVVTPGVADFRPIWENIRHARQHLDYRGKAVLDLGSMEGLWAFEAEQLGAQMVVATDCYYEADAGFGSALEKFLLCRAALNSRVIPYYNVSPYRLRERLDLVLDESWPQRPAAERRFDIVQHLGVLYHLRDPLLSLLQARSMLRNGGGLLIETVVVDDDQASYMLFNGVLPEEQRIYQDVTTWWAPTRKCLFEILRASLFAPLPETINTTPAYEQQGNRLQRAALVCRATGSESVPAKLFRELTRSYRNPGLDGAAIGD